MSTERDLKLSQGFDAGNYCNAYETQDLDTAIAHRSEIRSEPFRVAFFVGFFGSYALHEIPQRYRDVFDEAYHSELGQRVLELGYCDSRSEDYATEQNAS